MTGRPRPASAAAAVLLIAGCAAGPRAEATPWRPLFDGHSLAGLATAGFGGDGAIAVADGRLQFDFGSPLTGVTFAATLPDRDYELLLVGRREAGHDFFAGLTFPVPDGCLSLVLGGWGGSVCGLSSLDGADAARNATRRLRHFAVGRDHRVVVQVTARRIAVTIDGDELLAVDPRPHRCDLRAELEPCRPLGLASFATRASFATVAWRPLGSAVARE